MASGQHYRRHLVDGDLEEALDLARMRSMVRTRLAPADSSIRATSRAEIGSPGALYHEELRQGVVRADPAQRVAAHRLEQEDVSPQIESSNRQEVSPLENDLRVTKPRPDPKLGPVRLAEPGVCVGRHGAMDARAQQDRARNFAYRQMCQSTQAPGLDRRLEWAPRASFDTSYGG